MFGHKRKRMNIITTFRENGTASLLPRIFFGEKGQKWFNIIKYPGDNMPVSGGKAGEQADDSRKNPLVKYIRRDLPGIFNEASIFRDYLDRYFALDADMILPPYEVLIHPSSVCNLRCAWCIGGQVAKNEREKTEIASKKLRSTLSDPRNMEKLIGGLLDYRKEAAFTVDGKKTRKIYKIDRVSFSGIVGEPLMAEEAFARAVDMLKEKDDVRVGIFSNATRLNDRLIEKLLKIDYINISIDAGRPDTYARLKYGGDKRGEAVFRKLIGNIDRLVKARNRAKTSRLEINASFILYPDNYRGIYEAAKMLKKIGIDNFRMKQDNWGEHLLSERQMKEAMILLDKVDGLTDEKFRFIRIHRLNKPSEMKRSARRCKITDLMAAVGSDGNVYPCNYHPRVGGYSYGNAVTEDFRKIWEGERRKAVRSELPAICPKVCDPFKNRANTLFDRIDEYKASHGSVRASAAVKELTNYFNN